MMKFGILFFLLMSGFSYAGLDIKPGLWTVSMSSGGKEINPMAQMQKSLESMPPEKRKMMMEMMAKNKIGMGAGGAMQICYSKEMISNPESFATKTDSKCKVTIVTNTSSKMVSNMKCEDGTTGDVTMTTKNSENYSTIMNFTKNGKKSVMKNTGKFISSDCGSVKPII